MIYGFKGFKSDRTTHFGDCLEEGKTYSVEGPLKIGFGNDGEGNGYHMCERIADVFRFFQGENVVVATVEGSDENIEFEDRYWGNSGMHVCRSIKVIKYLSREEILDEMSKSTSYENEKFLMTYKLTDAETDDYINHCRGSHRLLGDVMYYQKGDKEFFNKPYDDQKRIISDELNRIDAKKGKAKVIEMKY